MTATTADVSAELVRLIDELDRCVAEVAEVAAAAFATRGPQWAAIVRATLGREPAGTDPVGTGANGAEVRAVLKAVASTYDHRLACLERALEAGGDDDQYDDVEEAIWTLRHRRLDGLVQAELTAYLARVAPRPSVTSVFAAAARKAAAPSAPAVEATGPSVDMVLCQTCGAPRLAEVLYSNCAFCGQPFFPAARTD